MSVIYDTNFIFLFFQRLELLGKVDKLFAFLFLSSSKKNFSYSSSSFTQNFFHCLRSHHNMPWMMRMTTSWQNKKRTKSHNSERAIFISNWEKKFSCYFSSFFVFAACRHSFISGGEAISSAEFSISLDLLLHPDVLCRKLFY